jgi:hypothetical protein
MAFLLIPLILIGLVLYVSWPLLREESDPIEEETSELDLARQEKEQAVADLKDVEMDYRMGKLSEEDYARLKEEFEARALVTLEKVESLRQREPSRSRRKKA